MSLICCCCGKYTKGKQWWNRDKGFGLCKSCHTWIEKKETAKYMLSCYGIKGINCAIN